MGNEIVKVTEVVNTISASVSDGSYNLLAGGTIGGPLQLNSTLTVGVDDTGYDVKFFGDAASKFMHWDASEDELKLPDSTKLTFGTGGDLEIYHDGNNSYIADTGTGDLIISGSDDIFFRTAGGQNLAIFNAGGSVDLRYANSKKFETTSTGATITGKLICTGDMDVSGTTTTFNSTTVLVEDPILTLGGTDPAGSDDNKDRGIEFHYHDGTDPKVGFFGYDDSASAFTFLTAATNSSEVFSGTAGAINCGAIDVAAGWVEMDSAYGLQWGGTNNRIWGSHANNYIKVETGGTERIRIDNTGLGIGCTAPDAPLEINAASAPDIFLRTSGTNPSECGRIRFCEATNHFQGGFIHYDGSANLLNIGVHHTSDETIGNDINAISIARADGNVGIGTDSPSHLMHVNDGDIYSQNGHIHVTQGYHIKNASNGAQKHGFPSDAVYAFEGVFVGIGTASPAQKLDVIGRVRSSYNSGDYFEMGSSDNGGFLIGKSGGTEVVNVRTYGDSYFNGGNFGIGTSSTDYPLVVSGSATTSGGSRWLQKIVDITSMAAGVGGGLVFAGQTGSTTGERWLGSIHGAKTNGTDNDYGGDLVFNTRANGGGLVEAARFDSSGRLGVSSTSPEVDIHLGDALVNGFSVDRKTLAVSDITNGAQIILRGQSPRIWFDSTNSGSGEFYLDNSNLKFFQGTPTTPTGELMRLNSTGLGIGGTPSQALHVNTSTNYQGLLINGNVAPNVCYAQNTATTPTWKAGISGTLGTAFSISQGSANTERLMILDGGNVGIGTTSPSANVDIYNGSGWAELHLDGSNGGELKLQKAGTTHLDIYASDSNSTGSVIKAQSNLQFSSNNSTAANRSILLDSNGNVGIGTTSPSQKMTIVGTSDTGIIQHIEGASSYGATTKYSRAGLYSWKIGIGGSSATGNNIPVSAFGIVEGADTRLTVATGGNVGIGTTNPLSTLHIGTNDTTSGDLMIGGNNDPMGFACEFVSNNTTKLHIGRKHSADSEFIERVTILDDGNVGIGTDSPAKLLHLNSAVNNGSILRIESTATDSYPILSLKNDAREYQVTAHGGLSDAFTIYDGTAGAHRLTIATGGNVGIGTTSPSSLFECRTSNTSAETVAGFGNSNIDAGLQILTSDGNLAWGFNAKNSRSLVFQTNQTERMRIDSSGDIIQNYINYTDASNYEALKISAESDHIRFRSESVGSFSSNTRDIRFNVNTSERFLISNAGVFSTANYYITGTGSVRNVGSHLNFSTSSQTDNDIIFKTNDTEAARFDSSGDFITVNNIKIPDSKYLYLGGSSDLQIYHNGFHSSIDNYTSDLYIRNRVNGGKDIIFLTKNSSDVLTELLRLDGSASSVNIPDNVKLKLGTSSDLQISSDGSNTTIDSFNRSNMLFRQHFADGDMTFQCDDGSGGVETYFRLDGSFNTAGNPFTIFPDNSRISVGNSADLSLFHNGTSSNIENITGNLNIINYADDKDIIFKCDDGSGGTETYFYLDGSLSGGTPYTRFPDSSRLVFGDGADLLIEHDGTNSWLNNATGDLKIRNSANDKDIIFECDDGSGGVETYFYLDGSTRYTTFNRPTVHTDGDYAYYGTGYDLKIWHDGTNSNIQNTTGALIISNGADDQDIIFQSDDGSGGLATYFYLDGSHPRTIFPDGSYLQIGSSTGAGDMQLLHDGTDSFIQNHFGSLYIKNTADDKDIIFQCDDGSGGVETYFYLDGSASGGNPIIRFPDNSIITLGTDNDCYFYHNGSSTILQNNTGHLDIKNSSNDADLRFYCDNGSGGDAEYFRLDGGREVVNFSRGIEYNVTAVSNVDYSVTSGDYIIHMHSLSAGRTVTIPSAQCTEGRMLIIKDGGGQSSMHNITIATEGSETIDGAATKVISSNYGSVTLYADHLGANWFTI